MALAFNGATTRSRARPTRCWSAAPTDGGRTWSEPITLIRDGTDVLQRQGTRSPPIPPTRATSMRSGTGWRRRGTGPTLLRAHDRRRRELGADAHRSSIPGPAAQTHRQPHRRAARRHAGQFLHADRLRRPQHVSRRSVIRSTDKGATWSRADHASPTSWRSARATPRPARRCATARSCGAIAVGPRRHAASSSWQDARFSGGALDGIALSRSTDGGLTWSRAGAGQPRPARWPPSRPTRARARRRHDRRHVLRLSQQHGRSRDAAHRLLAGALERRRQPGARAASRGAFDLAKAPLAGGATFSATTRAWSASARCSCPSTSRRPTRPTTATTSISNFALGVASAAAKNAPSVVAPGRAGRSCVARLQRQGLEQALPAVPAQWRAATMQLAERVMRDRMPARMPARMQQQRKAAPPR